MRRAMKSASFLYFLSGSSEFKMWKEAENSERNLRSGRCSRQLHLPRRYYLMFKMEMINPSPPMSVTQDTSLVVKGKAHRQHISKSKRRLQRVWGMFSGKYFVQLVDLGPGTFGAI